MKDNSKTKVSVTGQLSITMLLGTLVVFVGVFSRNWYAVVTGSAFLIAGSLQAPK